MICPGLSISCHCTVPSVWHEHNLYGFIFRSTHRPPKYFSAVPDILENVRKCRKFSEIVGYCRKLSELVRNCLFTIRDERFFWLGRMLSSNNLFWKSAGLGSNFQIHSSSVLHLYRKILDLYESIMDYGWSRDWILCWKMLQWNCWSFVVERAWIKPILVSLGLGEGGVIG